MAEIDEKYSYNEIDELITQFQAGDKDAALTLLNIFEPYLKKYHRIIKEGLLNLKDKDSTKFISLFIKDYEVRKKLLMIYQPIEIKNKAYFATNMLCQMCKEITSEDLMQELTELFLIVSKRYKKKSKRINFCGYLFNVFRFEVFRRISYLTLDPLVHKSEFSLSYNDESNKGSNEDVPKTHPSVHIEETIMLLEEDLGNSWLRGLTCDELFLCLTPTERLILKLSFINEKSDSYIAEKIGVHRNTINRQKIVAIEKLKEAEAKINDRVEKQQVFSLWEDNTI